MRYRKGTLVRLTPVFVSLSLFLGVQYGAAETAPTPPPVPIASANPSALPRPVARPTRIMESEAPTIDGDLSDPVWQKATLIEKFFQVDPENGTEPTERTVLYVAYDKDNLYFAMHAYDSNPSDIAASVRGRDNGTNRDDEIRIMLDPGRTTRDGYIFEIGAAGGFSDALAQNNTDYLPNWNTIWYRKGQLVADGWVAEAAIPFRSLSYGDNVAEWGFDFIRLIQSPHERVRWAPTAISVQNNDLSYEGTLEGLTGMDQGLGLDVQVFAGARFTRKWDNDDSTLGFFKGGNLYYKLTPSLTGTLTVATDFSDAPLDRRQVNTTRFSLFTPETRDFFLQDAAAFEYGGRGFFGGGRVGMGFGRVMDNGRPFFSRNIGLVRGQPVSVLAGAKLSGEFEGIDIGALSVRTADNRLADGQQLTVVRLTTPVLKESKMGVMFTNGDPTGLSNNTVAGVDFQYFDSAFMPGKRLNADVFYLRSFSDTKGEDSLGGASLVYPNEPFQAEAHWKHLGNNYAPALGFANRVGINDYHTKLLWRERFQNSKLRWAEAGTRNNFAVGLGGRIQTRESTLWGNVTDPEQDALTVTYLNTFEHVEAPFFLPGGVLVPAGRYEWNHVNPRLETSDSNPLSMSLDIDCCSFYNGDYFKNDFSLNWRMTELFSFTFEQVSTFINMPTGDVEIEVSLLDLGFTFTPDMELNTQIQYDNITQQLQILARYRWEYEPGQEIFASIGDSSMVDGPTFHPNYEGRKSLALIRIGHTFQF